MTAGSSPISRSLRRLLRLRVWVGEFVRPGPTQTTLFWAGVIGFVAAVASLGFREAADFVHFLFTQHSGGFIESFASLPWWQRVAVPLVGGALAGTTLMLGNRIAAKGITTDYMEAVVIGDGRVSAQKSLVKCTSALFSVASGASIGREGPLVQLSAMLASLIGRMRRAPRVQLRLMVACGAAAGIASAYNAPIGGALFVSEIILQSIAMETFGPLVFSSVVATLTTRQILGAAPLYQIDFPLAQLNSNWEIGLYLVLGVLAGLLAPLFLKLLRGSERLFSWLPVPLVVQMALGGAIVGGLAVVYPEVCGNGYAVINSIFDGQWLWPTLLAILAFKLIATAVTFGSGAVGGVFTPTLFVGACVGFLFENAVAPLWPGAALHPDSFMLVGMGAFLAATTQAPLMAIIMLFELTLDYELIMPLMLACVVAHTIGRSLDRGPIYSDSLKRKGAGTFRRELADLTVGELMNPNPVSVLETADFRAIAETFLGHRFNYVYVVDESGGFRGVVGLHDIKNFLNEPGFADVLIARDILHEDFPTLALGETLNEALDEFSHHAGERVPVVDGGGSRRLLGSVSKSDLLLALAERGT